jgi:2-phosphosulfolactate phosphatase
MLPLYRVEESIVVIIDIFRATSSICYGIHNGARAIIPVSTVEECRSFRQQGHLLAAERNGMVVDGFDFGNSPFSYSADKVADKTIVLTTTNGTRSIELSRQAKKVVIGSFLNLSALCNWLREQTESVLLVCAGWKGNFSLEDTLFAGAVVDRLQYDFHVEDDSAVAAMDLYLNASGDLRRYLRKSSHSERLKQLDIEEDIAFCLQVDQLDTIPVLQGDALIRLVWPAEKEASLL